MPGIGQEILNKLSGGLDISGHVETDPVYVAAERILRRWFTVRGTCKWAPAMGLGLGVLVNSDLTRGDLGRLEIEARAEAMRVNGVTSARVTVAFGQGQLVVKGNIRLNTGAEFVLTAGPDRAPEILKL